MKHTPNLEGVALEKRLERLEESQKRINDAIDKLCEFSAATEAVLVEIQEALKLPGPGTVKLTADEDDNWRSRYDRAEEQSAKLSGSETLTKTQIEAMEYLKAKINFERASFSRIHPQSYKDGASLPTTEAEVDEFIKKRTQLYRDTWINPVLDILIKGGDTKELTWIYI